MATDPGLIEYLCDQLEGLGAVRSRKMFGEYMLYCNDKPVLIICDDRPMVKMLPILEPLLKDHPTAPPYEGAKPHYVLDPDDRETLREAVRLAAHNKPELGDIDRWVDSPFLGELQAWMAETYQVSPSVEFSKCSLDRGWNLKFKKGSKSLCVLYVRPGWFTAMVTLNAKQLAEVEILLSTFSASFRKVYRETALFNGGKWLLVDVKEEPQLEDVKRLIQMKEKPPVK